MFRKSEDTTKIMWLARNISNLQTKKSVFRVGSMSGTLLLLANVMYFFIGISIIILGMYQSLRCQVFTELLRNIGNADKCNYNYFSATGLLTVFISGTGVMGVQVNYRWYLCARAFLITIVVHATIFLDIYFMNHFFSNSIIDIYTNNSGGTTGVIKNNNVTNLFQTFFQCCGSINSQDYIDLHNQSLPYSCCYDHTTICNITDTYRRKDNGKVLDCDTALYNQLTFPDRLMILFALTLIGILTLLWMLGTTVLLKDISHNEAS